MADEELLVELECPVCTHYMHSPIHQCVSGHSLCSDCFEKVTICPICNQSKGSARSYALEKLAEKLRYPCKNQSEGCSVTAIGINIRDHEKTCSYGGVVPCPLQGMNGCIWSGNKDILLIHAKELHAKNVFEKGKLIMSFDYVNQVADIPIIINVDDDLFGFLLKKDKTTNLVAFVMKYYGPASNAKKYFFRLKFTIEKDCNINKTLEYTGPVYSSLIEPLDIKEINFEKHMLVHDEMLKKCCAGNTLIFKVEIERDK